MIAGSAAGMFVSVVERARNDWKSVVLKSLILFVSQVVDAGVMVVRWVWKVASIANFEVKMEEMVGVVLKLPRTEHLQTSTNQAIRARGVERNLVFDPYWSCGCWG